MANQCGNGNYLDQPAWGPARKPMPWYSYIWTVICSYWMPGEPIPLQLNKQQKRQLRTHILIALGVIVAFIAWILILAYCQTAIRGY